MTLTSRTVAVASLAASLLTVVLGVWVFALPAVAIAVGFKLAAVYAMLAGKHTTCRGRLGLALLFDAMALLSWGTLLLTAQQPVVAGVGAVEVAGSSLAWLSASLRATAHRLRWGAHHRDGATHNARGRQVGPSPGKRVI